MNKYTRQPKTCKWKLRHNDKEKMHRFFVVYSGSLAVLGMQDIDRLGMLSINCNSHNRQVAEESNEDKDKKSKPNKRQQTQNRCRNTKQDAKDANAMVIGSSNKELELQKRVVAMIPFQKC